MKRAIFIMIAVLAVLLVYPATTPSAKSPSTQDSPTIQIITPPGNDLGLSGDGDDGDGDDLGGMRDGFKEGTHGAVSQRDTKWLQAKIWWMYLFFHRVF